MKKFSDISSRLDTIPKCGRRSDGYLRLLCKQNASCLWEPLCECD